MITAEEDEYVMIARHTSGRGQRRQDAGWLVLAVSLLMSLFGTALMQAQTSAGITVSKTFQAPDDMFRANSAEILRLSSDPTSDDRALSVSWRVEGGTWFPSWYLFIESETGLVPEVIKIGPAAPIRGTTYEFELSYDYASGTLALAVFNATDQRMLQQGAWRVEPASGDLHVLSSESTNILPGYRPVGASWDTVVVSENGSFVPMRLVERTEVALVRANMRAAQAGELYLVAHSDGESIAVPLGEAAYDEVLHPIPVDRLPLGTSQIALEYRVDGKPLWVSRPREITVGRVESTLVDAVPNPGAGTVEMTVSVSSDGPLDDVDLYLSVDAKALEWDQASMTFADVERSSHRFNLTASGINTEGLAHVRVPVESEPALWRLELSLASKPELSTRLSNNIVTFGPRTQSVIISSGNPAAIAGSPLQPVTNWDAELATIEGRYTNFDTSGGSIVFIGSSSIRGWRTLDQDFPGLPVINAGFGGSHIIDSVYLADRLVFPFNPHTVVMFAGSNDIASGKSPERVFADYVAFVHRVHEELPKARIIFISISPSPSRWSQRFNVQRANRLIEMYTETDDRLEYIDVYSLMLGEDGLPKPDIYLGDDLHMNPNGYAIWTEVVRPYLGL